MSTPTTGPGPTPDTGVDVGLWGAAAKPPTGLYSDALNTQLSVLMQPAAGLTWKRVEEMRRDYQVSACLLVLTLPLVGVASDVVCEDEDQQQQLQAWWETIRSDVQRSMARTTWAGYSPNTLRWEYSEKLGLLAPIKVRDLDPATCSPLTQPDGSYAGLVQGRNSSDEVVVDNPLMTLWLTEGMESGNLYGRRGLLAAFAPWQEKLLERVWHARTLEKHGDPVTVIRHPVRLAPTQAYLKALQEAPDDDARALIPLEQEDLNQVTALALGESLRNGSVIALSSARSMSADGKDIGFDWSVEYLEATQGSGSQFREAIDAADQAIARALFIPDLLFSNSDSGAYALGQEHRSIFDSSTEGRLADYARQLSRHLIDRVRVLNYGPNSAPASLKFAGVTDTDRDRFWGLASGLMAGGQLAVDARALAADLGIPLLAPEDDGQVETGTDLAASPFASVGLPALISAQVISPAEARALLGIDGPPPTPTTPAAAPPADELAAHRDAIREALGLAPDRVELAVVPDASTLPGYQQPPALAGEAGTYRRVLTARETRVKFGALERDLNTAEGDAITGLLAVLDGAQDKVLRAVRAIAGADTQADAIALIGDLSLGSQTTATTAVWQALVQSVWTLGLASTRDQLAPVIDVAKVPSTLGPEARATARTSAAIAAARHGAQLLTAVQSTLLNGVKSGTPRVGLEALVTALIDTERTSEAKPARLSTRLLASQSLNQGRRDAIDRGGVRLAGAQYSAILDRTTCGLCERLDEQVLAVSNPDLLRFTAPLHHNCRCVWVWITAAEEDFTPTWQGAPAGLVDQYGGLVI